MSIENDLYGFGLSFDQSSHQISQSVHINNSTIIMEYICIGRGHGSSIKSKLYWFLLLLLAVVVIIITVLLNYRFDFRSKRCKHKDFATVCVFSECSRSTAATAATTTLYLRCTLCLHCCQIDCWAADVCICCRWMILVYECIHLSRLVVFAVVH